MAAVYLSHRNRDPVAAAGFLSRALHRIVYGGQALRPALEGAAKELGDPFITKCAPSPLSRVRSCQGVGCALLV